MADTPRPVTPPPALTAGILYRLWCRACDEAGIPDTADWSRLPLERQSLWVDFARIVRDYTRENQG